MTNFTGASNEVFLTLTYASQQGRVLRQLGNVKSEEDISANNAVKRLISHDIANFVQRLKRKYQDEDHPLKYLWCMQPHASGAVHFHVLLKLENQARFSPTANEIERLWKLGHVNKRNIHDIPHLGAYISSYMLNEKPDPDNPEKSTHYQRLKYYPTNMRIFSGSHNLRKPKVYKARFQDLPQLANTDKPRYVSATHYTTPSGQPGTHYKLFYDRPQQRNAKG